MANVVLYKRREEEEELWNVQLTIEMGMMKKRALLHFVQRMITFVDGDEEIDNRSMHL